MHYEFPAVRQSPFFILAAVRKIRPVCLAAVALAVPLLSTARADFGPNIFPSGAFSNVQPTYVPWAGVDSLGNIHCIDGKQLAVDDNGRIGYIPFAPSVAVGDLNGDGKPDLVVADSYGYFWYFPNSGTPQSPAFTQGEVIPIWLGVEEIDNHTEATHNFVPRIQLLDPSGGNKLDIYAGSYTGELFHIPNTGSSSAPGFRPTVSRDSLVINTRKKGVLWCNYLSPCLTSLFGGLNSLDLVLGEGTYSANSIYLLRNIGTATSPTFNEDHLQKIVPGMGSEQLTPAVVDWNNDGKPDVICGDRTGHLTLYLNNSADPTVPTFATGTPITIAGQNIFGTCISVTIADLTGNHLPNLLISKSDGTIVYALNSGTLGAPKFTTPPTPIRGVLPPNYHYMALHDWVKYGAWGNAYELVAAVNPTNEPGFTFPEGEKTAYAMKFFVWPFKSTYFPGRYQSSENYWSEHDIHAGPPITLKLNQRYRLHFWAKTDGNAPDLRIKLAARDQDRKGFHGTDIWFPISAGTSWSEVTEDVKVDNEDDKTINAWSYDVEFHFTGQPTFYIDDVQIQEVH